MVRPDARVDALFDRVKFSDSAACSTFARVAGLTFALPLSARDTVACDTPAAAATSLIVALAMVLLVC